MTPEQRFKAQAQAAGGAAPISGITRERNIPGLTFQETTEGGEVVPFTQTPPSGTFTGTSLVPEEATGEFVRRYTSAPSLLQPTLPTTLPSGSYAGTELVMDENTGEFVRRYTGTPQLRGGTSGFSGGAAIVGEAGPELVVLPRGAQVFPNKSLGPVAHLQAGTNPWGESDAVLDLERRTRLPAWDLRARLKTLEANPNQREDFIRAFGVDPDEARRILGVTATTPGPSGRGYGPTGWPSPSMAEAESTGLITSRQQALPTVFGAEGKTATPFLSMQQWGKLLPSEQSMWQAENEARGFPWEDYAAQWSKQAGRAGFAAKPGATGYNRMAMSPQAFR